VSGEAVAFWVVAVVLVASSLAVVLTRNLFHSVLYLAAALVATGVVFLLLDSPFLFGVQLLLYAGGVVTILVFAIMLTEQLVGGAHRPDQPVCAQRGHRGRGGAGGGGRLHRPAAGAGRTPAAGDGPHGGDRAGPGRAGGPVARAARRAARGRAPRRLYLARSDD